MIAVDTSFLMRLYLDEIGADLARRWVVDMGQELTLSSLNRLEFHNALSQKMAWGELSQEDVDAVRQKYRDDLRRGSLRFISAKSEVWDEAVVCAKGHTPLLKIRSLDIFHVAFAMVENAEWFCSFDRRQRSLAERVGLKVNSLE